MVSSGRSFPFIAVASGISPINMFNVAAIDWKNALVSKIHIRESISGSLPKRHSASIVRAISRQYSANNIFLGSMVIDVGCFRSGFSFEAT